MRVRGIKNSHEFYITLYIGRTWIFDDSRIPVQQYKPVSFTKTRILYGPVDVETNRVVSWSGSKTWTFRICADFYRVNRNLRRAGNAAASKVIDVNLNFLLCEKCNK